MYKHPLKTWEEFGKKEMATFAQDEKMDSNINQCLELMNL